MLLLWMTFNDRPKLEDLNPDDSFSGAAGQVIADSNHRLYKRLQQAL